MVAPRYLLVVGTPRPSTEESSPIRSYRMGGAGVGITAYAEYNRFCLQSELLQLTGTKKPPGKAA